MGNRQRERPQAERSFRREDAEGSFGTGMLRGRVRGWLSGKRSRLIPVNGYDLKRSFCVRIPSDKIRWYRV